jgi:hypothetical protein
MSASRGQIPPGRGDEVTDDRGPVSPRASEIQVTMTPGDGSELVVCIHGLARTRHCWWPLRYRLRHAGYRTAAWTYPLRRPIEALGRDCRDRLTGYAEDPAVRRIHVVTHSLGGIILRYALTLGVPARLGRIIQLAPPNRGSAWARRLGPWLGWLAPALPQLSDAPDSFVNRLAPPPGGPAWVADGISIPGRGPGLGCTGTSVGGGGRPGRKECLAPPFQIAVIAAARDSKCPLPTTHLVGEASHTIVPGRHTFIMYRQDVAQTILGLLGGDRQGTSGV